MNEERELGCSVRVRVRGRASAHAPVHGDRMGLWYVASNADMYSEVQISL